MRGWTRAAAGDRMRALLAVGERSQACPEGASEAVYARVNRLRDWLNAQFPDFDLYLEDVWPPESGHADETHLEYRLRSRRTLEETPLLAVDVYACHRDAQGVWHLDAWREARVTPALTPETLLAFMDANGPPWSPAADPSEI